MLILGVDCSGKQGSVALVKDGKPVYQCTYDSNMTHSQNLLSLINNAVTVCGVKNTDIDLFAVTLGPGSFTGLRIGLAVIKGMEYEEYFWDFAAQTAFYGEIINALECFTTEQKQRDTEDGERLIRLAISEAENPNNYIRKLRQKTKNEVGRYGFIQNIT